VRPEVSAVCELLGLSAVSMPCEGRALVWVDAGAAGKVLERLRSHPAGREAAIIGRVENEAPGRAPVTMVTVSGEERPLDLLSGAELPRIC
jgi:hydrogenase expression/formation protein HypE